jgi:hypothetical protein
VQPLQRSWLQPPLDTQDSPLGLNAKNEFWSWVQELRDLLVLALGGGIAVAGWQVAERRSDRKEQGEHKTHARVTYA